MLNQNLKIQIGLLENRLRQLRTSPFPIDTTSTKEELAKLYLLDGRNPDGSSKLPFGQSNSGLGVEVAVSDAMKPLAFGFTVGQSESAKLGTIAKAPSKPALTKVQKGPSAGGMRMAHDLMTQFGLLPQTKQSVDVATPPLRSSEAARQAVDLIKQFGIIPRSSGPASLVSSRTSSQVTGASPSQTQIRQATAGTLENAMVMVDAANPKLSGRNRALVRAWLEERFRAKGSLSDGEVKAAQALSRDRQALYRLRIIQANAPPKGARTLDREYQLGVDDHMYGPGGFIRSPPEYPGEPESVRRSLDEERNRQPVSEEELAFIRGQWEQYLLKEQGRKTVPDQPIRWKTPEELQEWAARQERGIADTIAPLTDHLQGLIPGAHIIQNYLHSHPELLQGLKAVAETEGPDSVRGRLAALAFGQAQQISDGKAFTEFAAGTLNLPFDVAADLSIMVVPGSKPLQRLGAAANVVLKLGPEKVLGLTGKLKAFAKVGKLKPEFEAAVNDLEAAAKKANGADAGSAGAGSAKFPKSERVDITLMPAGRVKDPIVRARHAELFKAYKTTDLGMGYETRLAAARRRGPNGSLDFYDAAHDLHFKGGHPVFTDVIADIYIEPTGTALGDRLAAIARAGEKAGYQWHHHEEWGRMQLVATKQHDAYHRGGWKIWYNTNWR